MKTKINLITCLLFVALSSNAFGTTLNVGSGKTYANPTLAAAVAKPGDTVLIHPGNYQGTFFISNLSGKTNAWIVIMGLNKNTVIMKAGSEGLHFSDCNFIKIQDITFTGHTGNAMNMDDAGTIETPSKHIIVFNCDFKFMGAQGNNDFLKLSGLDSFEVANCQFFKAAAGGSGIDMVGCHYGNVHHCNFDSMGSNCIQMKGGTQFIKIENNFFKNGGQRSLNLGGSTGYAFFRPIDAKFEAADIKVYANVFIKSQAPIAFVGSERIDVGNNTIYLPEKWVMRILQETVDTPRFVPCRNNMFRNNIIYFSNVVTTHVNIGTNTLPGTFLFSHNLWYNSSNPSNSSPNLPTTELSAIVGQDPLFTSSTNFTLTQNSLARESGTPIAGLPKDMQGFNFKNPPSRGAYEYSNGASINIESKNKALIIFPNPTANTFFIHNLKGKANCTIVNLQGQIIFSIEIDGKSNSVTINSLSQGIYNVIITEAEGKLTSQRLIKL